MEIWEFYGLIFGNLGFQLQQQLSEPLRGEAKDRHFIGEISGFLREIIMGFLTRIFAEIRGIFYGLRPEPGIMPHIFVGSPNLVREIGNFYL